jgi:hypothetical protein
MYQRFFSLLPLGEGLGMRAQNGNFEKYKAYYLRTDKACLVSTMTASGEGFGNGAKKRRLPSFNHPQIL